MARTRKQHGGPTTGQQHLYTRRELDDVINTFDRCGTLDPVAAQLRSQAQDLADQAEDTGNPIESIGLAIRALTLNPHCVDAFVHLGRLNYGSTRDLAAHMKKAMAMGERALGGQQFFRENQGSFWRILQTRPYMRARAELAHQLTKAGRYEEAIRHYEDLLKLNPRDNQGLRFCVVGCYFLVNDLDSVRKWLRRNRGESRTLYSWTLVLERYLAAETDKALCVLQHARRANRFAERYLTRKKRLPKVRPVTYSLADESEAIMCAECIGEAWKQHREAIAWVTSTPGDGMR